MRKLSAIAAALVIGLASAAGAATLNFDGTMTLSLGTLPPIVTTDSGVASVTFSSGTHIDTLSIAGGFNASTTIPLTDPNNSTLVTLIGDQVTLGTPGTPLGPISGGGPLTERTLPIVGNFRLCIVNIGCNNFLEIPLEKGGAQVGVGGILTVNGFGKGTHISISNAPWTVGQAVITGIFTTNGMIPGAQRATENSTFTGFAHGPSSASTTGQPSGLLQLVSPTSVVTNLNEPSNFLGLPLEIRLHFVPEPGLMLLLGSGVAGLALLGRLRTRR